MRINGGRITGSERTVRPTLRTNARDKEREEVQVDSETVLSRCQDVHKRTHVDHEICSSCH